MKKQQLKKRIEKIIYTSLGIFYTVGLAYIFFFARRRWRPLPNRIYNLIPFRNKAHYLYANTIHTRVDYLEFYKDLVGNILLFIPFPFLLGYLLGIKSYRRLLLISIGTSLFIEITQFIFKIGVADVDDLLLNTIGASIGLMIMYAISLKSNNPLPSMRKMANAKMS